MLPMTESLGLGLMLTFSRGLFTWADKSRHVTHFANLEICTRDTNDGQSYGSG